MTTSSCNCIALRVLLLKRVCARGRVRARLWNKVRFAALACSTHAHTCAFVRTCVTVSVPVYEPMSMSACVSVSVSVPVPAPTSVPVSVPVNASVCLYLWIWIRMCLSLRLCLYLCLCLCLCLVCAELGVCVFAIRFLCETNMWDKHVCVETLIYPAGRKQRRTRVYFKEGAWSARSQLDLSSWHRDPVSEARHALAMAVACGDDFTIIVTGLRARHIRTKRVMP